MSMRQVIIDLIFALLQSCMDPVKSVNQFLAKRDYVTFG